jgi:hypothetical protein
MMKSNVAPKVPKGVYFTQDTEDAIIEFNNTDCSLKKNEIYSQRIHSAFYRLAEILIHRFKFYNFDYSHEDVKNEVISFMIEKISKFDESRGFKAFSYFSIVAKNYLIAENSKNYKKIKQKESINVIDSSRDIMGEEKRKYFLESTSGFMDDFVKLMDANLHLLFPKPTDNAVAECVVDMFRKRESIDTFNKKIFYFIIKEKTRASAKKITDVVKTIKILYSRLYLEYENEVDITELSFYDIKDILGRK